MSASMAVRWMRVEMGGGVTVSSLRCCAGARRASYSVDRTAASRSVLECSLRAIAALRLRDTI